MGRKLFSMLRAVLICYLVSLLFICLAAFLLWRLQFNLSQMRLFVYAIYGISCLLGGFLFGHIQQEKRVLWGAAFGLLYFLILILLSILLARSIPIISTRLFLSLGICLGAGFIGALLS